MVLSLFFVGFMPAFASRLIVILRKLFHFQVKIAFIGQKTLFLAHPLKLNKNNCLRYPGEIKISSHTCPSYVREIKVCSGNCLCILLIFQLNKAIRGSIVLKNQLHTINCFCMVVNFQLNTSCFRRKYTCKSNNLK